MKKFMKVSVMAMVAMFAMAKQPMHRKSGTFSATTLRAWPVLRTPTASGGTSTSRANW